MLKNNPGITSMGLELNFNEDILEFVGAEINPDSENDDIFPLPAASLAGVE